MSTLNPLDDGFCFACGPHNPDGLQMQFERDGERGARAVVALPERVQGYRAVAHGGIVATLLDEGMAHACRFAGHKAMTASMDLRFRKPVPLGTPLTVRGRCTEQRKNVLFLEASVEHDGVVLASATGKFLSYGPLRLEEQTRA